MKRLIIMMVLGISILYATPKRVCWQYNPAQLIAWNSTANIHTVKDEVKDIKGVYIWKKENKKEITLVTKIGERIYRHPFISMYEKGKMSKYGGECDSGQLQLDKNMNLHLEFLYFMLEVESADGPKAELVLNQRDTKAILSATQVTCPEYVVEGLTVCYSNKDDHTYKGCVRSKLACHKIEKRHFGTYPNEASAEGAYWRCIRSEPKY